MHHTMDPFTQPHAPTYLTHSPDHAAAAQVKQREDNAGLGIEEHDRAKGQESWWFNSFEQALQSFKAVEESSSSDESESDSDSDDKGAKKRRKKDKKKKRKKKAAKKEEAARQRKKARAMVMGGGEDGGIAVPSFEDLFKATGGKRLGTCKVRNEGFEAVK